MKAITFLLTVTLAVFRTEAASCPSDMEKFGNSCYFFSTTAATWTESRELCSQRGSHLVVVNDKDEDTFLINKATSEKAIYWLDGTDKQQEGKWIWSSLKTPITYFNWDVPDNEPDGKRVQNCLAIFKSNSGNYYKWYDLECNHSNVKYICESELKKDESCCCVDYLIQELAKCKKALGQ